MPGIQELLVIVVVALLVFGPERLPELSRRAARLIVRVRTEAQRNVQQIRELADLDELERDLKGVRDELRGPQPTRVGNRRGIIGISPSPSARGDADTVSAPPPTDPEAT